MSGFRANVLTVCFVPDRRFSTQKVRYWFQWKKLVMEDLNLFSNRRLGLAASCCCCDGLSAPGSAVGDAPSRTRGRACWQLCCVPRRVLWSSPLLQGFVLRGFKYPVSHSWAVEAGVSGWGVTPVLAKLPVALSLPERGPWDACLPCQTHPLLNLGLAFLQRTYRS